MPIIPKHIYGNGGDIKAHPANLKPVGSGPYRLTEYKQGEYYTLVQFDKFFLPGRPYLDKIVIRLILDENSLMLGLEWHEINMLPYLVGVRLIEDRKSSRLNSSQ